MKFEHFVVQKFAEPSVSGLYTLSYLLLDYLLEVRFIIVALSVSDNGTHKACNVHVRKA